MKKTILILAIVMAATGCRSYKAYQSEPVVDVAVLRDTPVAGDSVMVPWQSMYADPMLQQLIAEGLQHNVDMLVVEQRVREAQAMLVGAKKAFLPSLTAGATGTARNTKQECLTGQIDLTASWEVDIAGRLGASKRSAAAALEAEKWQRQAVRTQVVASIAEGYYMLLYLDKQIEIAQRTIESWREQENAVKALIEAGRENETALLQTQTNRMAVESSLLQLQQSVRETENALSTLMGRPAGTIARDGEMQVALPGTMKNGISLKLLAARPDIRQAEWTLVQNYYNAQAVEASFYPSLTLSGVLGWTNDGSMVTNPAQMIANAVASLAAPLLNRGQKEAQTVAADAQMQQARIQFQQALLDAGREVNDAYTALQTKQQRIDLAQSQLDVAQTNVDKTRLLYQYSSTTYLDVITARQPLLQSELTLAEACYNSTLAAIKLYRALGGGVDNN